MGTAGGFVDMDFQPGNYCSAGTGGGNRRSGCFHRTTVHFENPVRPRGRVVSVAYFALVNLEEHPSSDARASGGLRPLPAAPAFRLRPRKILARPPLPACVLKVRYQPIGFELLPEQFTLSQLQKLYDTILGVEELNKRNFAPAS